MKKASTRKKSTAQTQHPDHSPEIARVRRIAGQIEGIERMIVERRYCPQIINQVQAAASALHSLKIEILKRHLNECLMESARSQNFSKLIEQVLEIVQPQMKKG